MATGFRPQAWHMGLMRYLSGQTLIKVLQSSVLLGVSVNKFNF
jgi:hypothetical protein